MLIKNNISKELLAKFQRLDFLKLPKTNFSNALVINAGDGFVCDFLKHIGIKHIVGYEQSSLISNRLEKKTKNIIFCKSLKDFSNQKFDLVIILDKLSFFSSIEDRQVFENIIKQFPYVIVDLFAFDNSIESGLIEFKITEKDSIHMPTTKLLLEQFKDYIPRSIYQAPTPFEKVNREIWHFRKKLPYAVLLSAPPSSGKTTIAKSIFNELTLISLDEGLVKINQNRINSSENVKAIIQTADFSVKTMGNCYRKLSENSCYLEFVEDVIKSTQITSNLGVVIDGFVPNEQLDGLKIQLSNMGYFVVETNILNTLKPDIEYTMKVVESFYLRYS